MKIAVIGCGYVGLVTGACLADMGNDVIALDLDALKVSRLNAGEIPIYEPGLADIVARNQRAGRLCFSTDDALAIAHGDIIFIAVGTPADEDGSADLSYVLAAARRIGELAMTPKIVVGKSTVPPGTGDAIEDGINVALAQRGLNLPMAVVSNPEFLKEGAAVADFMRPDRVILGGDDDAALATLRALYAPFLRNHDRLLVMSRRSAELCKYAANAMLATRISFMNEMAHLAERIGADIEQVRLGIGSDTRIGTHFLYAGTGFGGSCFPKDLQALRHCATTHGVPTPLLAAVQDINATQKRVLLERVLAYFGDNLAGRRIALWGLAFKPETDDVREAPSLTLVRGLCVHGAEVCAYDPVAGANALRALGADARLTLASDAYAALAGADALLVVTEWKEFRCPDVALMRARLRQPVIFDGRNLYDPATMAAQGFHYQGIGRGGSALPALPAVARPAAASIAVARQ